MHTRPLDYDAASNTTETFHFDPADDHLYVEVTQNVAPILDENKAFMCDAADGWQGDMHRVASIPHSLLPEMQKKGIMDMGGRIMDKAALKRFLNDRDNLWLRTRPGRV